MLTFTNNFLFSTTMVGIERSLLAMMWYHIFQVKKVPVQQAMYKFDWIWFENKQMLPVFTTNRFHCRDPSDSNWILRFMSFNFCFIDLTRTVLLNHLFQHLSSYEKFAIFFSPYHGMHLVGNRQRHMKLSICRVYCSGYRLSYILPIQPTESIFLKRIGICCVQFASAHTLQIYRSGSNSALCFWLKFCLWFWHLIAGMCDACMICDHWL